MRLKVESGAVSLDIERRDTSTTKALAAALPFESTAQTWGEEVYFSTPVSAKLEPDAQQTVEPGTACFWTQGEAIALPFGRTPISTDARSRLAAPCNLISKILGDCRVLANVRSGAKIKVTAR
ncbi:MAG: hypothetical protein O3A06_10625 [Proteobacteria bacterium]|nr:hypothetical protein [Pseudomonadota bacterium]MDA0983466.1 hypothetical protein [Pseudomonadota bacterium]